jgi:hypothetical protein
VIAQGSNLPISGLYAIPGTAGGTCYEGYLGALCTITTFGFIAGDAIGRFIQ